VKNTRPKPATIDEYIAAFPKNVRTALRQVRATVRRAAPAASEAIKYGMPTFVEQKNLVHFAAFKRHIGFFPSSSGVSAFEKELGRYKHAKGSIQFPLDEPMPLALIARIVRYRVKEVRAKAASRPKTR